jgi:hypothetical protein
MATRQSGVADRRPGPGRKALEVGLITGGFMSARDTRVPEHLRLPIAGVTPPPKEKDATAIATVPSSSSEYRPDGSFHILSDSSEIELIDNANDPGAKDPVNLVRLP